MFKGLIKAPYEIRHTNPAVSLQLRQDLKRDESLSEELDYGERDNQLVGIAVAFSRTNPDVDVRLLTADVGPMASAKYVGLLCEDVPDDWMLSPELDERDKKLAAQNDELRIHKNAAPLFNSWFVHDGKKILKCAASLRSFSALSASQVESLMSSIKEKFPEVNDFEPKATFGLFTTASRKEIEDYKRAYLQWLEVCEKCLRTLHVTLSKLEPRPKLQIFIVNEGHKPADHSLVFLRTDGSILILTAADEDKKRLKKLPPPPPAPKRYLAIEAPSSFEFMRLVIPNIPNYPRMFKLRERELFYAVSDDRGSKSTCIKWECQQWRHKAELEEFGVTVYTDSNNLITDDELKVTVRSTNLVEPYSKKLPISITVEEISAWDEAQKLVDQLIKPRVTLDLSQKRLTSDYRSTMPEPDINKT